MQKIDMHFQLSEHMVFLVPGKGLQQLNKDYCGFALTDLPINALE
jgi:hypothetical protein